MTRSGRPIGTYARHYYDLYQLSSQPSVLAMLVSPEYAAIKHDYDCISRAHFDRDYFHPEGMSFANSDALFPPSSIVATIKQDYDEQCQILCYGAFPSWREVQERFDQLRPSL